MSATIIHGSVVGVLDDLARAIVRYADGLLRDDTSLFTPVWERYTQVMRAGSEDAGIERP
jgi:hypothetical protein